VEHVDTDTIAALSTPLGRGGIAVIRICGADTSSVLRRLLRDFPAAPVPRRAYHSFVMNGDRSIDECVVVFFKGPHSYTGEDTAEVSIHSNPFLVEEVLNLIFRCGIPNVRGAMPGEFTFRAFKHGKMDLIQAESVNQLINANSRYYAHMTFGSLEGRLSRIMTELKEELINLGIRIETKIEFEEDQFFDEIGIANELTAPIKRLESLLANARFNELLNKGLNVVIVGKVNVGKSSLFNALLMEERSIISDIPGTTRDFIREKIYIDGFPVEITDVAGINRDTVDSIEALGIRRSLERLEGCDAAVFMLDGTQGPDHTDLDIFARIRDKKKLIVVNKLDGVDEGVPVVVTTQFPGEEIVGISVLNHRNIDSVTAFLKSVVATVTEQEAEFAVNQRQQRILEDLKGVLDRVYNMVIVEGVQVEIVAEEIRGAIGLIGRLMGEVTPDDILNGIFSSFCVGK